MVSTVLGMHRSRIGLVLIDHPEDDWEAALDFWAGVQGVTPTGEDEGMPHYRSLGTIGSVALESQRTGPGTPPRVHLDIETDDVPAEVARVLALGATVLEERKGYTILRDPAGMVFCVVPVQTGDDFEREALTWDD
jgi:predicted enzyme related to lactoylglutathione lyase